MTENDTKTSSSDCAGASPVTGKLWIGRIDPRFDPRYDQIIGTWCLCGVEEDFPDWETMLLEEPFDDPAELVDHTVDLNTLCRFFLSELTERLNARHGVSKNYEFWRLLAMPWLVDLVYLAWYRWLEISQLTASNTGIRMRAELLPDELPWQFNDYGDFNATTLVNVDFSSWVSSMILRRRQPHGFELIDTAPPASVVADKVPYIKPPETRVRGALRKIRAGFRSERCAIGSIGNEFSITTKIRSIIAETVLGMFLQVLPAKRKLNGDAMMAPAEAPARFPSMFITLAKDLIDRTMPLHLTDNFSTHLENAEKAGAPRPGKLWLRTSSLYITTPVLFRVALSVSNGELLLSSQHGGTYGALDAHQFPGESEYRSHGFITWGWTEHSKYEGRFIPLPSAQLSAWRNARQRHQGKIVVVAQAVRYLPGRISSEGDIYNRGFARPAREVFFNGMNETLRAQVRYRPYDGLPASVTDSSYLLKKFPDLNIIRNDFHNELLKARLVVVDYPGTTLCQTFAAGIPTIGFWNPDAYRMCPQAEPYYDAMQRAGLIFHSGEEAAAHVEKIWEDVESWWESEDVKVARNQFCEQFARSDRLWWWHWMKMLWRL